MSDRELAGDRLAFTRIQKAGAAVFECGGEPQRRCEQGVDLGIPAADARYDSDQRRNAVRPRRDHRCARRHAGIRIQADEEPLPPEHRVAQNHLGGAVVPRDGGGQCQEPPQFGVLFRQCSGLAAPDGEGTVFGHQRFGFGRELRAGEEQQRLLRNPLRRQLRQRQIRVEKIAEQEPRAAAERPVPGECEQEREQNRRCENDSAVGLFARFLHR